MKRKIAILLIFLMVLPLEACNRPAVVKEIYTGTEYMQNDDVYNYVAALLGVNCYKYETLDTLGGLGGKYTCTMVEKDSAVNSLDRVVSFSDGTKILIPCSYNNVNKLGWTSKLSEDSTSTFQGTIYCNKQKWSIGFGRSDEDYEKKRSIKDSTIDEINILIGDFSSKHNYALILESTPEFEYMGINRNSTPDEVIKRIGLPNSIEHDGVNMTFEYRSYDNKTGKTTGIQFCWLTKKDGPEIMREFKIRHTDLWIIWW